MTWVWTVIAGGVGLVFGFISGVRLAAAGPQENLQEQKRTNANDLNNYLQMCRRVAANRLIRHDPDRYAATFSRAYAAQSEIEKMDRERRTAEFSSLSSEFPLFTDFDPCSGHEYVLINTDFSDYEYHEDKYIKLARFQILLKNQLPDWRHVELPQPLALEYLPKYIQQIKDGRFKRRLDEIMMCFYSYRDGRDEFIEEYETLSFKISPVRHVVERRLGIHIRDTNEYALHWQFDDADRHYQGYYRSNAEFSKEIPLDGGLEE
jgi:hypothetical protein